MYPTPIAVADGTRALKRAVSMFDPYAKVVKCAGSDLVILIAVLAVRTIRAPHLGNQVHQLPHREPGSFTVNHPVAIRAYQREIVDMCAVPFDEALNRFRMVTLNETGPSFSVCAFEVESATFTHESISILQ